MYCCSDESEVEEVVVTVTRYVQPTVYVPGPTFVAPVFIPWWRRISALWPTTILPNRQPAVIPSQTETTWNETTAR